MFVFFKLEVFKNDWIVVFKKDNKYTTIINNLYELKSYLNGVSNSILVGFNNYKFDNIILAAIILDKIPYKVANRVRKNEKVYYRLNALSFDASQELRGGIDLHECQGNLGESIIECPIKFDTNRKLTNDELLLIEIYLKHSIKTIEKIFELREQYFDAKVELINEFGLPSACVKNTRAVLTSKILNCISKELPADRLIINYSDKINWELIPQAIKNFYKKVHYDFRCGGDYTEIEKRRLQLNIAGVSHVLGFGGIHGALENYKGDGNFLHIDVESFYTTLMLNENFISRKVATPSLLKTIQNKRLELKNKEDTKHKTYKTVLNSITGAMKNKYNALYDPKMNNCICVNGQIILTQLIIVLSNYCRLIQSNTDGIIVKYDLKNYNYILKIVSNFEKQFNISFKISKINKIAQKDVNNYVVQYDNGEIKGVGSLKNFAGGTGERNTLSIIDRCLVNYYIKNIPVEQTIIEAWKNYDILPFQIIAKMGNTYDGMFYEFKGAMLQTQKVNRVFATNNKDFGGIYKKKGESFQKIANTSENSFIYNGNFSNFNKSLIDLNYYINLAKKQLF